MRLLLLACAFATVVASAQLPGIPGMDIMYKPIVLLQRPEVEKELKLDGKQKSEIKKVTKAYDDAMQKLSKEAQSDPSAGMRLFTQIEPMSNEYGKKAMEHLSPEQAKRLTEIQYQCAGNMCLKDADVQKALALDENQKLLIDDIVKDVQKNRMNIMMANARDPKKMKSELEKYRVQADETLLKILTPGQQEQLKALMGPPFKDLKKILGI